MLLLVQAEWKWTQQQQRQQQQQVKQLQQQVLLSHLIVRLLCSCCGQATVRQAAWQ
jgi:hypothetical protein